MQIPGEWMRQIVTSAFLTGSMCRQSRNKNRFNLIQRSISTQLLIASLKDSGKGFESPYCEAWQSLGFLAME